MKETLSAQTAEQTCEVITMYEELVKNLRKMQSHEYCVLVSIDGFPAMQIVKQAADAIEDLSKTLDEEVEINTALGCNMPVWIPVTERLPEESGHYLIYVIGGEFKQWSMVTMAYYHKRFYYDDMEDNFDQITHWMPLPQPPKEETDAL